MDDMRMSFLEKRPCGSEELQETIADCIVDVMLSEEEKGCVVVPTKISLGYSDDGGLGILIGSYLVTCDNSPPAKEAIIELIRETYMILVEQIAGMPIRIGDLKVIPSEHDKEFDLEIEIHELQ